MVAQAMELKRWIVNGDFMKHWMVTLVLVGTSTISAHAEPAKPCGNASLFKDHTGISNEDRIKDIEYRIKDCATEKKGWKLVVRTQELKEVWKQPYHPEQDKQPNPYLLWGDILPVYMSYSSDQYTPNPLAQSACQGSLSENGRLQSTQFRLPTTSEYLQAEADEIRSVLPNIDYEFWTLAKPGKAFTDTFKGGDRGGVDSRISYGNRFIDEFAVRCVGYNLNY